MSGLLRNAERKRSLFWRYFVLMAVVTGMLLSAMALNNRYSAQSLQQAYLDQAEQAFYSNCQTFSDELFRTRNLLTAISESQAYTRSSRAGLPMTPGERIDLADTQNSFLTQCSMLRMPGECFLYFGRSQSCVTRARCYPEAEQCFSRYLIYGDGQELYPRLQALAANKRDGQLLLPVRSVSVAGKEGEDTLILLVQSAHKEQVCGFLYPVSTVLDAFQMNSMPAETALELIADDGTVLLTHNTAAEADSARFSTRLTSLGCTAVLSIPNAWLRETTRAAQNTTHLVLLICIAAGTALCFLFSRLSVQPFRRLIRDHAADGTIGPLADAPANELLVIDQAFRRSQQRSEELRAVMLSSLLVRTFSGVTVSQRERARLAVVLPMFRQSLQAAVLRDCTPTEGESMMELLKGRASDAFHAEFISEHECVLLLPAEPERLDGLQNLVMELNRTDAAGRRFVCGVSAPFLGLDEMGSAVQQARFSLPEDGECAMNLYSGDNDEQDCWEENGFDLMQFQRALTGWDREEVMAQLDRLIQTVHRGLLRPEESFYSILCLLREAAASVRLSFEPGEGQYSGDPAADLTRLRQLAAQLFDQRSALQQTARQQLCEDIVQYMKDGMSDQSLCMASVARAFCMSEGFVRSAVLGVTGMNFTNYLLHIRMEEAARLLQETDASNAEIAQRCGYTAPSTFYRNFRRYYHVSPGEYKENRSGHKDLSSGDR